MSYAAFREQCAKVLELYEEATARHYGDDLDAYDCANIIRAMPLPEVNADPYAYVIGTLEDHGTVGNLSWKPDPKLASFPLYLSTLDAEAIRKENEKLRERIAELSVKKSEDEMRADFEKWAKNNKNYCTILHVFSLARHPNEPRYYEFITELCFQAWKAALKGGAA